MRRLFHLITGLNPLDACWGCILCPQRDKPVCTQLERAVHEQIVAEIEAIVVPVHSFGSNDVALLAEGLRYSTSLEAYWRAP